MTRQAYKPLPRQPRSQGLSFCHLGDPGCGWSRAFQILGGKFNCNCERGGKGVFCSAGKIMQGASEFVLEVSLLNWNHEIAYTVFYCQAKKNTPWS